jgi:hypothetical protein
MYGFTSCSISKEIATKFADSDPSQGKHAVIFEIKWKRGLASCWYFDKDIG